MADKQSTINSFFGGKPPKEQLEAAKTRKVTAFFTKAPKEGAGAKKRPLAEGASGSVKKRQTVRCCYNCATRAPAAPARLCGSPPARAPPSARAWPLRGRCALSAARSNGSNAQRSPRASRGPLCLTQALLRASARVPGVGTRYSSPR